MLKSQTTLIIYCQSKCVSDCSVYVWFCLTLTLWLWTFSLALPAQWLPEPKKSNSNCDPRRPPLRQSSSNRLHTANQRQSEPLIHHETSHFQVYSWPWMYLYNCWPITLKDDIMLSIFSVCVMTSRIWLSWLDMIKLVKTWLTNAYSTVTFQTSYFGILLKCNTLWSTEVFYCVFYYKPFMTKVAAIWCNNLMRPPPRQSCERGCKAHALEGKTHALLTPSAPLLDSWPHLSRSTFLHTLPFPSIGIVAALDPHI